MIPTPHYYMDSSYRVVLIFGFVKRPGFDSSHDGFAILGGITPPALHHPRHHQLDTLSFIIILKFSGLDRLVYEVAVTWLALGLNPG